MDHHLPFLISDLALILAAAAITTLIFKKLKQPLVLGYIIAGLLVGPEVKLLPTVMDQASIKTWAEIGVIFLLFSLGLEFSFKKLMRVGGAASITAFVEIIVIVTAGFLVGRMMGWKTIDCIFLGGMLASSSTTIIIRAFEEMGVKTQQFARIVFGVLIVEDIVVILILVLLPTIAISQQFHGAELAFTVVRLLFFLSLWFLAGIFLLPTFLKQARTLLDDETLLILSIGMCMGMVVLATQVGFSAELGAFIMGSIFAETTKAEKIEHILKGVKDLFAAIFFVSIGMMINLNAIWEYRVPVLIITLVTIFGKFFSTTIGALLSGQPLKQSVQVGMSMAQIGEFAFIIATLGLTLGVTSDFLFPVAVGVSAITTFTTPYMIKFSEPLYQQLNRILPARLLRGINKYSSNTQNMQATSEWKAVLKAYASIVTVNAIVVIAIVILSSQFLLPFLESEMENKTYSRLITLILTSGVALPFLWAMAAKRPRSWAYKELWVNKRYNRGPLLVVEGTRLILALLLVGFLFDRMLSSRNAILVALPVIIIALVLFRRRIQLFYNRIERRFLQNLNARETAAAADARFSNTESELTPWDAHLAEYQIHPLATYVGWDLEHLAWREKYGINIALIERGEKLIYAPGRHDRLYPQDKISIIGTDEQLNKFRPIIESVEEVSEQESTNGDKIVLQKLIVDEYNLLKGQTIRSSGIRERTHGLVVGIERDGQRLLNPESTVQLEWNDVIWIVGNRKLIQGLAKIPKS